MGDLLQADFRSDQVDAAAGLDELVRHTRDVQRDQIHRDTAHHRNPLPSDHRNAAIAQRPGVAVRVARADGRDPHARRRGVGGAVTHRGRLGDLPQLQDAALDPEHGPAGVSVVEERVAAEQRYADAGHVARPSVAPQRARGVADAGRGVRQQGAEPVESPELFPQHGRIPVVGACEVGHDIPDVEPLEIRAAVQQFRQLAPAHAQAGHAGVDVDHRRQGRSGLAGAPDPTGALVRSDQDRDQAVVEECPRATPGDALEDEDVRIRQQAAQSDALPVGGREELPAARVEQRLRNPIDAQPVSVRLDDSRAVGGRHGIPAGAVVGRERVQIDRDEGAQRRVPAQEGSCPLLAIDGALRQLRRPP